MESWEKCLVHYNFSEQLRELLGIADSHSPLKISSKGCAAHPAGRPAAISRHWNSTCGTESPPSSHRRHTAVEDACGVREVAPSYEKFWCSLQPFCVGGVGGPVVSESALRSAGTLLSWVRTPASAPRPDGGP
ncbi:hypothetical protein PoB_005747700 [Plakobranchus ocellatus]|uniref:Uncharacterized protein n=1 Tax=Plakobranchus ocellatus TaxID=259542 RepID=A0AAV4CHA2_9GAST|nr:hypothetical protein PoB_005747700 [Plakobranchus ocellatus]